MLTPRLDYLAKRALLARKSRARATRDEEFAQHRNAPDIEPSEHPKAPPPTPAPASTPDTDNEPTKEVPPWPPI